MTTNVEEFFNKCHASADGRFCGTSGAAGGGTGGEKSTGPRLFTADKRLKVGGKISRSLPDGTKIEISRDKRGYHSNTNSLYTPGGRYHQEGAGGISAGHKTLKEAVDFANRRLTQRHGRQDAITARKGSEAQTRASANKERAATVKANPNTATKLTRAEALAVEAAHIRQRSAFWKANPGTNGKGYKFDVSKTKLPSHVKATVQTIQGVGKTGDKRHATATSLLPATIGGRQIVSHQSWG